MSRPYRNRAAAATPRERIALAAVLLLALALRLWHIDFGLPALNDPDEPLFVLNALDMLREARLDPGWFGHPATTLFYALALIFVGIGAVGLALGQWADVHGFTAAVFANPTLAFLPMRGAIALAGVACVWMTWRIGREIAGPRGGLLAALLVACNAWHVELSQVIRTDVPATVLMLWSTLAALRIARGGGTRAIVIAGIAAGIGTATKWPAAIVLANPAFAILWRTRPFETRTILQGVLLGAAAMATLLLVSPYLVIDWQTVASDLAGEARLQHPGATGTGFAGNVLWYLRGPLLGSFGYLGLALAAFGAIMLIRRDPGAAIAILPGALAFFAAMARQALVWERWAVPLLPFIALAAATGIIALVDWLVARPSQHLGERQASAAIAAVTLAVIVPMLVTCWDRGAARANDTRQQATDWVRAHVPAGASVLVEYAAFDLLDRPGPLLFPLGSAGCVDIARALHAAPTHRRINKLRRHQPVIDIGYMNEAMLRTCRADVAILTNYIRYRSDPAFAQETRNYREFVGRGCLLKTFAPRLKTQSSRTIEVFSMRPCVDDQGAKTIKVAPHR